MSPLVITCHQQSIGSIGYTSWMSYHVYQCWTVSDASFKIWSWIVKNVKSLRSIHMPNLLKFTVIYRIRRILNVANNGQRPEVKFSESLQEFRNCAQWASKRVKTEEKLLWTIEGLLKGKQNMCNLKMCVEREEEQNTLPVEDILDEGVPTADAPRAWLPHAP